MSRQSITDKLVTLVRRQHIVRSKDLARARIPRSYLARLVERGQLQKLDTGIYTAPSVPASEHISLLQVSRKIPNGVICLLSALSFHEIGTQVPGQIWIAIDGKAWASRISSPTVRMVRFSGRALNFGVQARRVAGGTIRVYSPAKTVADCFKFRNKIGMDVALEALREMHRQKKASMGELFEAAKVCRVARRAAARHARRAGRSAEEERSEQRYLRARIVRKLRTPPIKGAFQVAK